MNRKIKFRAFSKHTGMINIDDNSKVVLLFNKICGWNIMPNAFKFEGEYLAGESQSKTKDFILMQLTGLKDKNGRDIYEGDILKYDDENIYQVVYSTESIFSPPEEAYIGAYMLKNNMGHCQLICNLTRPNKYAEIIGNIHQTPELLP